MSENKNKQHFQAAFDSFLEKVKQDPAIIALHIYGSLVRGDMWEGSDLDVYAITRDVSSLSMMNEGFYFPNARIWLALLTKLAN